MEWKTNEFSFVRHFDLIDFLYNFFRYKKIIVSYFNMSLLLLFFHPLASVGTDETQHFATILQNEILIFFEINIIFFHIRCDLVGRDRVLCSRVEIPSVIYLSPIHNSHLHRIQNSLRVTALASHQEKNIATCGNFEKDRFSQQKNFPTRDQHNPVRSPYR